jgi:hypothetical protein
VVPSARRQEIQRLEDATPRSPPTKPDIAALVVRMANENPTWGDTRIRGGLSLGHDVARNTIKAILTDHSIEPAPERGTNTPWTTFLAAQWHSLAAADFFTVEVLTLGGLVRYVVFFVMTLKSRTMEIAGITGQPHEAWMTPLARHLTDARDGFLHGVDHVILDRDPLSIGAFRRLLRDSGVTPRSSLPGVRISMRLPSGWSGSPSPSASRDSSPSAKGTSGLPYESSSIMIMRNGRTRVWATNSSRPRHS